MQGGEGVLGRNNTILTLALANFSSGVSEKQCTVAMQKFNCNFSSPLSSEEVARTVSSAYSGVYTGASRKYIRRLIEAQVGTDFTDRELFSSSCVWKKEAKKEKTGLGDADTWKKWGTYWKN